MSFTYDTSLGADKDWIRLKIGDTDSAAPANERLEDEEINAVNTGLGNRQTAAAACARALAAKFARKASAKTVKNASYLWRRYPELIDLAKQLERSSAAPVSPYAPGTSIADVDAANAETDRVQPVFESGAQDNPRA